MKLPCQSETGGIGMAILVDEVFLNFVGLKSLCHCASVVTPVSKIR